MRRKAYLGFQGTYHYVNFNDESKEFVLDETENVQLLEKRFNGDFYDLLLILGMNF